MKRYSLIVVLKDFTLNTYDFNSLVMATKTYHKIKGSVASIHIKDNMTKESFKL